MGGGKGMVRVQVEACRGGAHKEGHNKDDERLPALPELGPTGVHPFTASQTNEKGNHEALSIRDLLLFHTDRP